jgi:hypothetical protein
MNDAAAKYDAWADEIKGQLDAYSKLRKQVRLFPLFAFVTAPIGFLWAPWVALAIVGAWLSLWGTTLYITYMRTWQYRNELTRTRAEAERLRSTAG